MNKPRKLAVILWTTVVTFAGPVFASSSGAGAFHGAATSQPGCCDGPGPNELEIDVLDVGLNEGELVGSQLQGVYSVVFPPATQWPAPNGPDTYVWIDQARPTQCDIGLERQWAFSGEPHFPPEGDGDEVMQFLGPGDVPMVVNKISISIGFNNGIETAVLKAFDCEGNLLNEVANVIEGFEVMEINRTHTDPDIHYITVEAPFDPQGVGINCIQFPEPVPCKGGPIPVQGTTWGAIKAVF